MGIFSEEKAPCRGCPFEKMSKATFPQCVECRRRGKINLFQDGIKRSLAKSDGIHEHRISDLIVQNSLSRVFSFYQKTKEGRKMTGEYWYFFLYPFFLFLAVLVGNLIHNRIEKWQAQKRENQKLAEKFGKKNFSSGQSVVRAKNKFQTVKKRREID